MSHDGRIPRGRWISEGGRLHWLPADVVADQMVDDVLPGVLDEGEAADTILLPEGAPEKARIQVATAWLQRKLDDVQEQINELALVEREAQRQREEQAPPRRRAFVEPPSPRALDLAFLQGAYAWFEDALAELEEQAEGNAGRALVEWYLWLIAVDTAVVAGQADAINQAYREGFGDAHKQTQQFAERLTLPETDD